MLLNLNKPIMMWCCTELTAELHIVRSCKVKVKWCCTELTAELNADKLQLQKTLKNEYKQ